MNAAPAEELGLSTAEANQRRDVYGPNDPTPPMARHRLALFAAMVRNPLVAILLASAGISFFTGDRVNSTIIVVIVAISLGLDAVQNARSQAAMKRLQKEVALQVLALRDGNWQKVPRSNIVPGDLVRLSAGDLIPADGTLIEERDLHVQESALTGESIPVEKEVGGLEEASKVFLGTIAVSGTATFRVERTGRDTKFGEIAQELREAAPPTEFQRGLHDFGVLIMRAVVLLTAFVFLALVTVRHSVVESLLFAAALAVGLTPEFLPMITTLTLAKGAVKMAKRKVIVKNLASIQNFGSIEILCSDKTGTLTTGELTLEGAFDDEGRESTSPLELARLNALFQTGYSNPLDAAVLAKTGEERGEYQKVDEIPFDFERRRVSVIVEKDGHRRLVSKGAPEGMLTACQGGGDAIRAKIADLEQNGFRVLAIASTEVGQKASYGPADESGLQLEGILAFADPPMPDALQVLNRLKRDGIQVKVITGDNEEVARHVCGQVGLDPGVILLGSEIDALDERTLGERADTTTVFARVNPTQKNKIILSLKRQGHVVGYMGDGINDAPALHTADIGISFSSATEAAKDAAQVILTERSLEVLHRGVLEGRMAFGNVMKYILMGTSSNFGNMFSMAAAAVFLPFLPMLPIQILLNNLLYDLAQVTIPTDQVDPSFTHRPKRWDLTAIRNFMLWVGPVSSAFDFLTFYVLLRVFQADAKLFHSGWFVESIATQTLVIFVIRTQRSPWQSKPSRALAISVIATTIIGTTLPYWPIGKDLGFVPLPPLYLAFVAGATACYLALVEFLKQKILGAVWKSAE